MAIATARLFSGLPNPSVHIPSDTLEGVVRAVRQAPRLEMSLVGGLGYWGVTVDVRAEEWTTELPRRFTVFKGVIDFGSFALHDKTGSLEDTLLELAMAPDVLIAIRNSKHECDDGGIVSRSQGPPPYNPHPWNRDEPTLLASDCYNYAADCRNPSGNPGHPGCAAGEPAPHAASRDDLLQSLAKDGIEPVKGIANDPKRGWYAALFMTETRDYHFFRLDDTAYWSHKPGSWKVRNLDDANQPIPRDGLRSAYAKRYEFQTYLLVPPGTSVR
jgi:hypothetical protein